MTLNSGVAALWILFLATACVTRPIHSNHEGLLDHNGRTFPGKPSAAMNENEVSAGSGEIQLSGTWQWPLEELAVSSPYGSRGRKFHQGVDLRAPMRTPVLAANDGVVVYVGSKIRGYGRMIVLKHADNFYSVYAHHSKNLVKVGKKVSRGETIALSGKSGHASGPHLHFEIRHGTESYDPIFAIKGNIQDNSNNRKVASQSPSP